MRGIVRPVVAGAVVDVVDIVAVEIVIVVDVDVAAVVPIAITPVVVRPGSSQDDASPHGESHSRHVSRIGIWVIGIGGRAVNNRRIIGRNVNNFRVRLLNDDDLLVAFHRLGFHRLLLARLQRACALGLGAHALDRSQNILLLIKEGVPQIGRPLDVGRQPLHHIGHSGQRLHTWIPHLFGHGISQGFVF